MEERVGPYRLLAKLGEGGMGETFVGERVGRLGFVQRACVKRILPGRAGDTDWVSFFLHEAQVIASLRHPNLVAVHDFDCDDDGTWWMALELVDGLDLRRVLRALRGRGERLPLEMVVHVAIELAKALACVHAGPTPGGPGVIHRDVTPPNVLLSEHGAVQLADFGIAKTLDSPETRSGMRKGKAAYMALEQHAGDVEIDTRVDLFALGVVMFEMLAGERPFGGKTDVAVQVAIASNRRKDIRELAPGVPEELAKIVDGLLEIDREKRTPTVDAVIDALDPLAPRPSVSRRLGGLVRALRPDVVISDEWDLTAVE